MITPPRRTAVGGAEANEVAGSGQCEVHLLPIGDLIALGMTLVTIGQIIAEWDDIWREADKLAS